MMKRIGKDGREYVGKLLVRGEGLECITDSGKDIAVAIGTLAGARMKIGRSVFWNVEKVKTFLDNYSDEDEERVKAFLNDKAEERRKRAEERRKKHERGE